MGERTMSGRFAPHSPSWTGSGPTGGAAIPSPGWDRCAARARDGRKAADALRVFADCFCLPNSFHANGDQSKTGKSRFTYRPFTLEGNFAFAAGLQEMLLQSHHELIRVFPAVPPELEGGPL